MSRGNTSLLPADSPVFTNHPQEVPPDARPHTVVIVGNSGSGKSSAGRSGFVEPIIATQRRCCIIDPTGVWWGLRFMANGEPGYPVAIVGGLYGDVDIHDYNAVALANWIGEYSHSVILDVSEMTIGERQDFCTEFFAALYKANRRPLHLIVDEADEVAPQNPMPETRRLLHHFDRIVRRGRVRGFRPMMITQRPSVLHKNVMSQATALLAMRLLGSQDRDAVLNWIKGQGDLAAGKEVLNTLARMQTGEGWLWVPGLNILNRGRFPMFRTFDSSRTPKDDEPPVEPPGPFPFRDEFRAMLEPIVGDGPDAAVDLAELPADLAEQLAAAEKRGADRGRREGFEQGFHAASSTLQGRVSGVLKAAETFMGELRETAASLANGGSKPPTVPAIAAPPAPAPKPAPVARQATAPARAAGVLTSHPGAEKLLAALATMREQKRWQDICVLAGVVHGAGHFYVGRKMLIDQGYVTEASGLALITPAGRKVAGNVVPVPRAEILRMWSQKLKRPAGEMIQAIAAARGFQLNKAQLASAISLKADNGHWFLGVKAARDAGLIEHEGDTYRLTQIVREAP